MLGINMQHLATRNQDLELWAGRSQVYYLYACGNHLLKVVQEEEHVLVLQLLLHVLKQGLAGSFADVKRLSNGGRNQSGITNWARFTKKTPSAKRSPNSAATCKPKRVLPAPPGPVRVSRRTSSRHSSC